MSPERTIRGVPASGGRGGGRLRRLAAEPEPARSARGGAAADPGHERALAERALAEAAAELRRAAAELRERGESEDAEILLANAGLCADPALLAAIGSASAEGAGAAAAIDAATGSFAARIEALPDATLAARGADVRSLGRRAIALLARESSVPAAGEGEVLVAADLGPADVLELERVAGIALSRGAPTAHAAVLARSLGIPMVVGLGEAILEQPEGSPIALDGTAGLATLEPAAGIGEPAPAPTARGAGAPSRTGDGFRVAVRVNAAGANEVRVGLSAGAEGVGLLRTELAFLDAERWPDLAQHRAALRPVLAPLPAGAVCTVRTLDFGGDKAPPFLGADPRRGIALQLAAAGALEAQMRALETEGGGLELRVMLPLVQAPHELDRARRLLPEGARLGAMLETAAAIESAGALLERCEFASVGTNDLAHDLLGSERVSLAAPPAHHPLLLAAVRDALAAAKAAGVPLGVCGEAASDPLALPLLVGLGIEELSVGAARVGAVRAWLGGVSRAELEDLAGRALNLADAGEVAALVRARLGPETLDE
jgi:multiphosphoryl transfer protein